ncbi:MAG: cytochrome c oxidase assembly factor Coa1 family protein [Archangium sp.]|nr:cytochrome c oxidase assembly factor Coa1 family protein [Archangium sp.]MDP3152786.1 cytochrome c oxidase assembly factor Coa1 family protein [Archangium sp.]MDP3573573.1 cytochrome c oxidase assembly factor Coa1 family protein [Archangium sp.]
MTPNAESPMQQPSWFSRNWKWLLPVGCLVPLMCCGVFGVGTYAAVSAVIQNSGAYAGAIREVNANPEVADTLGAPVKPGFGMSGSVKENNASGSADFTVPLTGSKGEGSMHVVARRENGQWSYSTITVTAGGKTIDVLESAQPQDLPDEKLEEPAEPDGD